MSSRLIQYPTNTNEISDTQKVDDSIHIQSANIIRPLLLILIRKWELFHGGRKSRAISRSIELVHNSHINRMLKWQDIRFRIIVVSIDIDLASQSTICSQCVIPDCASFGGTRMEGCCAEALRGATQRASTGCEEGLVICEDYGVFAGCAYGDREVVD